MYVECVGLEQNFGMKYDIARVSEYVQWQPVVEEIGSNKENNRGFMLGDSWSSVVKRVLDRHSYRGPYCVVAGSLKKDVDGLVMSSIDEEKIFFCSAML